MLGARSSPDRAGPAPSGVGPADAAGHQQIDSQKVGLVYCPFAQWVEGA